MSAPDDAIDRAWRDGVSAEDRVALDALAAADGPRAAEARTLAALAHLIAGDAWPTPPHADATPALTCASRAARTWAAAHAGDGETAAAELAALDAALVAVKGDPHAPAARALADLALADLAMLTGDAEAARRRWNAIVTAQGPVATRIEANLKLATTARSADELAGARRHAEHAVTLAAGAQRPDQLARARVAAAMLALVDGDQAAARKQLDPLRAQDDAFATVLRASLETPARGLAILADALAAAATRGDPIAYIAVVISGARRYASIGHDADALLTLSAAITELDRVDPRLAEVLRQERVALHASWGEQRFAAAEQAALAILDRR